MATAVYVASSVSLCSDLYVQVTDKDLMDLIRKNIKLTIPYAGAFLKRDDRYVLSSLMLIIDRIVCALKIQFFVSIISNYCDSYVCV